MFSDRLKQLRASRPALTQAKFAELLGVSQQAVGLWERGKNMPSHDLVVQIANYFNVSTDYMMCLTDNPYRNPLENGETIGQLILEPKPHIPTEDELKQAAWNNVNAKLDESSQNSPDYFEFTMSASDTKTYPPTEVSSYDEFVLLNQYRNVDDETKNKIVQYAKDMHIVYSATVLPGVLKASMEKEEKKKSDDEQ